MCILLHGEYLLISQSRIPSNGMLIDTWGGGHMYLMILDLLQLFSANAFMSTQPVGGCHDSLLGCDINPLHSRSNQGSTLVALACLCINRAIEVALYVGIDMVILA